MPPVWIGLTVAPSARAICTAKVPTPPEASLTRTFWPGLSWPASRRPSSAVMDAIDTMRKLTVRDLLE